jgi:hypothetical protein
MIHVRKETKNPQDRDRTPIESTLRLFSENKKQNKKREEFQKLFPFC